MKIAYYYTNQSHVVNPFKEMDMVFYDSMNQVHIWEDCMKQCSKKDSLFIYDFHHFAKNQKDLIQKLSDLISAPLKSIFINNEEISITKLKEWQVILEMASQLDSTYHRTRQLAGIQQAALKGVFAGRPKAEIKDFEKIFAAYKGNEMSVQEACDRMRISRATFYRRYEEFEELYNQNKQPK